MNIDFSNYLFFVTGFNGFLGSHLVDVLLKKKATVVGLHLRSMNRNSREKDLRMHENFHIKRVDESTEALFTEKGQDREKVVCFHFAGNASALECQKNPKLAYDSNVQLTLRVLEYCRSIGVCRFIYPSTGYVYGNQLTEPAYESNRLISTNIYTSTKIAAEALIESYAHYYSFDCMIGRVSNVYGKESSYETVSGCIIKSVINGDPIVLNTLKPVRDFIFIDDVIDGFLTILKKEKKRTCSYFNISTGTATSIQKLAETACKIASLPKKNIVTKKLDQFSNTELVLSCEKLKNAFNWEPMFSIEDGLSRILVKKDV